jgi:hypothetical protein
VPDKIVLVDSTPENLQQAHSTIMCLLHSYHHSQVPIELCWQKLVDGNCCRDTRAAKLLLQKLEAVEFSKPFSNEFFVSNKKYVKVASRHDIQQRKEKEREKEMAKDKGSKTKEKKAAKLTKRGFIVEQLREHKLTKSQLADKIIDHPEFDSKDKRSVIKYLNVTFNKLRKQDIGFNQVGKDETGKCGVYHITGSGVTTVKNASTPKKDKKAKKSKKDDSAKDGD